jgi:hypothetical protein
MYDLWYSFGTAIMSPGLLTRLQGLEPEFQLVTRTITETADPEPTGMYDPPLTDDTFAGVLDSDSTTDVRKAIWTYLTQAQTSPTRSIPPVSIYTAGKFCQLLNVPTTDFFEDIIANANAVYKDALGDYDPDTFTPGFPAFLGVCLVDSKLSGKVANPADADLTEAIGEFGINPDPASPERTVIASFTGDKRFQPLQRSLLNEGPWRTSCADQFLFWVGRSEHAVM